MTLVETKHKDKKTKKAEEFEMHGDEEELKEEDHFMKKCEVFYSLRKLGHDVITEAIFEKGGRADIVDLNQGVVYEILHTESRERFNQKKKTYPSCYVIIAVMTKDDLKLVIQ